MACIDFVENKITFPSPKGGESRAFSVPMPTALRPLFEKLRKAKKKFTVEFPFQPSRRWQQFFIKIKKSHLCFHCLRVTYVNRRLEVRAKTPRQRRPSYARDCSWIMTRFLSGQVTGLWLSSLHAILRRCVALRRVRTR
jgi:hypothetical protein